MMQTKTKRKKTKTNPHGVNQYTLPDPRQTLFLTNYLDPKSPTFSRGVQSALKAGYTQEYADNLFGKMPNWLSEAVGDMSMLIKAERNLDKMLDLETEQDIIGAFGPMIDKKTKKPFRKENPNLMRIKADVSKFVAERLNKKKYGQQEIPAGNTFNILNIYDSEQQRRIADRIINQPAGS